MPPTGMHTPSRRMTLSSIPSSAQKPGVDGDRRMSIDINGPPKPRPPKGRQSMMPAVGRENLMPPSPRITQHTAASRRRSSIGGRQSIGAVNRRTSLAPPAPIVRTDPRPMSDKGYQQQNIRKLLDYLLESGYDYPVNHKTLTRPSGKDFGNIVTFLLRKVDHNFADGTMKFEDEVALNFKCLGYPFPISKTSLVAAGSPHTWPTLLAALAWLVEFLQSQPDDDDDDPTKPFESIEELEIKTDKFFFKYMHEAYQAFLRGDNQKTQELEAGLADRFERDDALIESEIERVTDLNATIVERMNTLSAESQDMPFFAKKREDYAKDLEGFEELIQQLNEHQAMLVRKCDNYSNELDETNKKIESMTKHIDELKRIVSSQTVTADDLIKMENERKGLNEALDRAIALREKRQEILEASRMELELAIQQLQQTAKVYNNTLSSLESDSIAGPIVAPLKVEVNVGCLAESQIHHIGVDLVGSVIPTMNDLRASSEAEAEKLKWDHQDALDRLEKADEVLQMAEYKLKTVEDKHNKNESTLLEEKEANDAKLSVRNREIEAMEEKVSSLRDPVALEEQMASYERQCAELQALQMKHEEENISKKKSVQEQIERGIAMMEEQQHHLKKKLLEIKEYADSKKSDQGLTLPKDLALD